YSVSPLGAGAVSPLGAGGRRGQGETMPTIVFDIHSRLEASLKGMEDMLKELKEHEDPRVRLAAAAEMRHHIALAGKTLETALHAEALKEFQAGILEALAEANLPVRRKIIGLFEQRADEP